MINGGHLVAKTLKLSGVETIFSIHGAHIDAIYQGCVEENLTIIDTRHEMNAGHAAEGYARVGKKLGVALVTAGGGFTNVLTSMANAYLDRTSVLYITGSGPLSGAETNTLQAGIDQVAMAAPVTKWSFRVTTADQIPRLLKQAIRIANAAPRGPVLIDIPWDVLTAEISLEQAEVNDVPAEVVIGSAPSAEAVEQILDILAHAERPVILVGSEVRRAGAEEALKVLTDQCGVPAFADFSGLGALRNLEDRNAGLIQGLYTFDHEGAAPDVVLMVGLRFGLNTIHGSGKLIPHGARVIQIDPAARELHAQQPVELAIACDVAGALEALAIAASSVDWRNLDGWRSQVHSLLNRRRRLISSGALDEGAMHPLHAVEAIASVADDNCIVVADGALSYLWLSEVISTAKADDFLCHGYLGSMGVGMGIALGAQRAVAASDKRVILVTGDGAVGYGIAEFDSMVRQNLPVVVVVLNNRSWGATLHFQRMVGGPNSVVNTRLENGAYDQAAMAFSACGYKVSDVEGLKSALVAALSGTEPACIDARVALDPVPPEEAILLGANPF